MGFSIINRNVQVNVNMGWRKGCQYEKTMTVYKHIRNSLYIFCEFQVRNGYCYEVVKRKLKIILIY